MQASDLDRHAYTTRDEINFIEETYCFARPEMVIKKLSEYAKLLKKRVNWGHIDRGEVMAYISMKIAVLTGV